jgi:hypothetical protein
VDRLFELGQARASERELQFWRPWSFCTRSRKPGRLALGPECLLRRNGNSNPCRRRNLWECQPCQTENSLPFLNALLTSDSNQPPFHQPTADSKYPGLQRKAYSFHRRRRTEQVVHAVVHPCGQLMPGEKKDMVMLSRHDRDEGTSPGG